LKASDEASVVYSAVGNPKSVNELCDVIGAHKDYITMATKGDIISGDAPSTDVVANDEQKVCSVEGYVSRYTGTHLDTFNSYCIL